MGYTRKGEYHINVYNPKHRYEIYQLLENEGEINKFKLALVNFKEKHPRAINAKVVLG